MEAACQQPTSCRLICWRPSMLVPWEGEVTGWAGPLIPFCHTYDNLYWGSLSHLSMLLTCQAHAADHQPHVRVKSWPGTTMEAVMWAWTQISLLERAQDVYSRFSIRWHFGSVAARRGVRMHACDAAANPDADLQAPCNGWSLEIQPGNHRQKPAIPDKVPLACSLTCAGLTMLQKLLFQVLVTSIRRIVACSHAWVAWCYVMARLKTSASALYVAKRMEHTLSEHSFSSCACKSAVQVGLCLEELAAQELVQEFSRQHTSLRHACL